MSYREAPPGVPLVTFLGGTLLALDAESGAKLWEQNIGDVVQRVIAVEQTLFVATRKNDDESVGRILVFDLGSGAPRGAVDVPFRIETALVGGNRAYFGGRRGLIAFRSDGSVLFHASPERMAAATWTAGDVIDVVMKDATGHESWRLSNVPTTHSDGLFVLGDAAAQPDFDR